MNAMNRILNSLRHVLAGLALISLIGVAGTSAAIARDASGKGSPEYGAGHTTPHGVKPGQGISGKPEGVFKHSGSSHVPGPKGGHDDESHGEDTHSDDGHDGGTGHVPGGKGKGGPGGAGGGHSDGGHEDGGHEDESGHEDGEEHEESHEPGPKKGGGHSGS